MSFRLQIRCIEKPFEGNIDTDICWICRSLGFYEDKDKDKTASQVFRKLLECARTGEKVSSNDIAIEIRMSRGAVVNHLNRLMQAGLVTRSGTKYGLRGGSLYRTIKEAERDTLRIFEDLKETAIELDERTGFPSIRNE